MVKRIIEIDDTLEELIKSVEEDIQNDFIEYLKENPELDDFDSYYQNRGVDALHEIADDNTPIYDAEIDGLYYLHSEELEESYKNAGIGEGNEENHKAITIYCYLEEIANEEQKCVKETFEEWLSKEPKPTMEELLKELKGDANVM